jgi:hypothetical protein
MRAAWREMFTFDRKHMSTHILIHPTNARQVCSFSSHASPIMPCLSLFIIMIAHTYASVHELQNSAQVCEMQSTASESRTHASLYELILRCACMYACMFVCMYIRVTCVLYYYY